MDAIPKAFGEYQGLSLFRSFVPNENIVFFLFGSSHVINTADGKSSETVTSIGDVVRLSIFLYSDLCAILSILSAYMCLKE